MEIKLNDILRLTDEEIARTKVRFTADYDGEDAIDVYKRDPERVNSSGFLWRVKQQMFSVGQIGVCLLLVRRDLWLLTTVKTITRELGVKHGVNYEAKEVARLKPYFNRVFVRWHRTRKQQNQCVWFGKLMDEFVVHSIESCEYDGDEFPGYDKVRLSYGQLEAVIARHRTDWVNALAGQKAVYLITDAKTGKMYVGSATSDRGMLLARWTAYIENGHGVKGSDTSVYVLLYMLDRGESEVTGSAAVCAADCVADLVYYAAEGERLVGLVKTRRLEYPPLAGVLDL